MAKMLLLIALLVSASYSVFSQNPIVPAGMYIADPSARVWNDGKIYVYGSLDESPDYYCSHRHYVLSSSDMVHWDVAKDAFASKGKNDRVPYSDSVLYAPDCQYKDGKYYLYFTLASPENTEGVAVSSSPEGPFIDARPIDLAGINEIDPSVFIDDDGQAYYIWGQFTVKMAKLMPNMLEIDKSSIQDNILTEKEHFFHEGGFLTKRNGIYYFVYAHMGRAGRPTSIGYATGSSPMGPFTYRGVLVDNDHSDPSVWNNHGSIVEFKNQWYVFYHRSTHNSVTTRRTCVEPIFFNSDGSINEVEMTTQGASGPMDPFMRMDAERACLLYGNVRVVNPRPGEEILSGIRSEDKAAYKYFNFEKPAQSFTVSVAPGAKPGKIDICLDNPWSASIGTVDIPGGGDGITYTSLSCKVNKPEGVRAVWLRFSGEGDDLFDVDWFTFKK